MRFPRGSFRRKRPSAERPPPSEPRPDPVSDVTVSPEEAARICSNCGEELSVAERMFYFLDAVEAPSRCRSCLRREARTPSDPESTELAIEASAPPPLASSMGTDGQLFEGLFLDSVRDLLTEELRRSGLFLERLGPREPQARAARDLHNEARWLLEVDRLREAVQSVRELRTLLTALGDEQEPPWRDPVVAADPTIDELYERVLERASVLSARLRSDLEERGLEHGTPEGDALLNDAWVAPGSPRLDSSGEIPATDPTDPPVPALAGKRSSSTL